MNCPHCLMAYHGDEEKLNLGRDQDGTWVVTQSLCPACRRLTFYLDCWDDENRRGAGRYMFRPRGSQRPPPSAEVPKQFAEDYIEACLVLPDSAKASAALSRRCLQHLLRDVAKVKPGDLFDEIQEVLNEGKLPSHISDSLDAVRHIGNFAAHPIKRKSTGEVIPVEPGEAEWNLVVLEALFDFYFVQPAVIKKKKDALNAKLQDAGKKPMK